MDNFIDKLSQRYNAQEMIKANSEADTAQMEGLQEQVEAYEAVLQEMRKLNYKNTELTEKMYSLVDESIEKVRTLQIEASENGANAEMISREMSDAVTGALNEALNNMDSTVARTISESLATALAEPSQSIKEQAMAAESVKEAISQVNVTLSEIKDNTESVKGSSDIIYSGVESVNTQLTDLANKVNDLKAYIESKEEEKNAEGSDEFVFEEAAEPEAIKVDNSELLDKLSEISGQITGLLFEESLGNLYTRINEVQDSMSALLAKQEAFEEASRIEKEELARKEAEEAARKEAEEAAKAEAEADEAIEETDEEKEPELTIQDVVDSVNSVKADVAAVSGKGDGIDAIVRGLWDSMENVKITIQQIADKPQGGRESEELRAAVMDISNSVEEIRTGLRNVKSAQDESKNTLKSSLDSAIYGLKQDNREIVEFVQRMNANLVAKNQDPDKERKEEEQREKEEENKRQLEERFRANEDFMHKESVKVYRNVQAVVNEKIDRQNDANETAEKAIISNIKTAKIIAIIAAVLSGADLVVNVLKILGIF